MRIYMVDCVRYAKNKQDSKTARRGRQEQHNTEHNRSMTEHQRYMSGAFLLATACAASLWLFVLLVKTIFKITTKSTKAASIHVAPSILFLALGPTSNSRLTPPIFLIFWSKNSKNAKNTNVGPLKETIPLTKKKAPSH